MKRRTALSLWVGVLVVVGSVWFPGFIEQGAQLRRLNGLLSLRDRYDAEYQRLDTIADEDAYQKDLVSDRAYVSRCSSTIDPPPGTFEAKAKELCKKYPPHPSVRGGFSMWKQPGLVQRQALVSVGLDTPPPTKTDVEKQLETALTQRRRLVLLAYGTCGAWLGLGVILSGFTKGNDRPSQAPDNI